jgi:hypothetical protein
MWVYASLLAAIPILASVRLCQVLTKPGGRLRGFLTDLIKMLQEQYAMDQDRRLLVEKWIFMLGAVLLWPLAVVFSVVYLVSKSRPNQPVPARAQDPEDAFDIKSVHLLRLVTVAEAESSAIVTDPLGRVPALPFGHLNPGWLRMLAQMQEGDKLLYGEVPGRQLPYPAPERHVQFELPRGAKRGYAIQRQGIVIADFLFEWD